MNKQERYKGVFEYFEKHKPVVETELRYSGHYQLAVAVVLSAQCTDKRVNIITPPFFKQFPDSKTLSKANVEEIFEYIKSCTYPNNKSKNLLEMAKKLEKDFEGILPSNINELQTLPGVGRKTANVLASVLFNTPVIAVDTHVFRVSNRIGLSANAKTPLQVELQLTKNIAKDKLHNAHHWLILHGRYICKARKPNCSDCGLNDLCKYFKKNVYARLSTVKKA